MPRSNAPLIDPADIIDAPLPTIHLNGTSKEELGREAREALKALYALRDALKDVTVHPRDFYTQPDGAEACRKASAGKCYSFDALAAIEEHLGRRLEIVAAAGGTAPRVG